MTKKNKTKILFIVPGFGLGGTTTALISLINSGLTELFDIDVFAISRRNYHIEPLISHDIGLNGLTTAFYGDFSQFRAKDKLTYQFIKLLKQNKRIKQILENWVIKRVVNNIEHHKHYDVVVGFQEGLSTRFASHFACPHKIAWIHCDYASAYGEEKDELDVYKQFEKIVCVSQFTRKGFVNRYPALSEKTIAIHNLFDAERILELSNAPIDDSRFDTSYFTIISMGRIQAVKRFYLIPEIAAQLKNAGLRFRWYILGSASSSLELKRLTDAIHDYGMENGVIYLGGKSNPYPYLKAADMLISTSIREACPMIFNEAKILHIPILSANFGSAYEFIEQGKDGFISSIDLLSQKIIELANHPNELAAIKASLDVMHTNDVIIEKLLHLFTEDCSSEQK